MSGGRAARVRRENGAKTKKGGEGTNISSWSRARIRRLEQKHRRRRAVLDDDDIDMADHFVDEEKPKAKRRRAAQDSRGKWTKLPKPKSKAEETQGAVQSKEKAKSKMKAKERKRSQVDFCIELAEKNMHIAKIEKENRELIQLVQDLERKCREMREREIAIEEEENKRKKEVAVEVAAVVIEEEIAQHEEDKPHLG